jgi:hypothetical protein
MESLVLEARNLSDNQPCFGDANMDKSLYLEPITPHLATPTEAARRSSVQT